MKWEKVKLGGICEFINGGAWSDKEYVTDGIPVLKVSNCKPSGFVVDDINYLPLSALKKYEKNKLCKYDVIIATVGSHPNLKDSAAGRSSIVNSLVEGFYLNQNAVCIRTLNESILNQRYVGYLSKYYPFQHFIQMRGRGAANQMRIAIGAIKEYEFLLPPLETQKCIADILSAYDDLIENHQKQIKLLEEAAQRLYKEWFVDLHFPGYENTKIVDGVPEGWEHGLLGDIIYESGKKEKRENRKEYKYYLPIDSIPKESLGYTIWQNTDLAESSLIGFLEGDIIFGAMRPYFHKVVVARDKGLTRSTCFVLNSKEIEYWAYIVMLMFSRDVVEYATQISVGTTMPYVRWKDLKQMEILIPQKEKAEEFQGKIKSIIINIGKLSEKVIILQKSREYLLPRLMSGEIEV